MKIFNQTQLQTWDLHTLAEYEVDSHALIQQAADLMYELLQPLVTDGMTGAIHIFCGMGQNGADGLALANLLCEHYEVDVYILNHRKEATSEFDFFLNQVSDKYITIHHVKTASKLEQIPFDSLLIDAILGTGISRPLDGFLADVVKHLNKQTCHQKIAIDFPTGLHPDKLWTGPAFIANRTYAIASRRLSSFFKETSKFIGLEEPVPLILSDTYYHSTKTTNFTIELLDLVMSEDIEHSPHSYKNSFGHVLFVGGSSGKMGAAVMASEAAFRAGCGLVTAHVPASGSQIMQIALPEAMVSIDPNQNTVTKLPDLVGYQSICIGCGMTTGVFPELVKNVLQAKAIKVIDADALNILARNPELMDLLDERCVLTPHIGEFHRLFGDCADSFERYHTLIHQAKKLSCYIILKGHHTMLATPEGICHINTTGSVALATAGSGDILAGYIAGFLAQSTDIESACRRAICFHGFAGDLLLKSHGHRGAIARDILDKLSQIERHTAIMIEEFLEDMNLLNEFDDEMMDDYDDDDPLGLEDFDDDPFGINFPNNPN